METNSSQSEKKQIDTARLHDNTVSPRDDRRDRGKILHEAVPHELLARFKPESNRPDPIELIEQSNVGRRPKLIPIRYGRMLVSPFTFYRGTAALFASDIGESFVTKVKVQTCGDAHLLNFGAFATPERNIVFDLNDFDETLPAPWEWDVKRLAASFVLAGRNNDVKPKHCQQAAEAVARGYRLKMLEYSKMSILDIWYDRFDWSAVAQNTSDPRLQKRIKDKTEKAIKRTIQSYYFPKMTEVHDGDYRIKDTPPAVYHLKGSEADTFREQTLKAFELYKQSLQDDRQRLFDRYKMVDVAIKVVGIGSVGTTCAVALMLAPDAEPLMLQLKEARASVLEAYAGHSEFKNHGQRVVAGQRIIQSASDIFLGWTEFDDGKHYYVRQLRDTKVKLEPDLWDGPRLVESAEVMGAVLARSHARSGDAAVLSGYLGEETTFEEAIGLFSVAYADQAEKDYELFLDAVRKGRMSAAEDCGY